MRFSFKSFMEEGYASRSQQITILYTNSLYIRIRWPNLKSKGTKIEPSYFWFIQNEESKPSALFRPCCCRDVQVEVETAKSSLMENQQRTHPDILFEILGTYRHIWLHF